MNQLKAGIVLNYVLIVLNVLVGLLYTPYMLRMMGQSEYGLYSLVASVISYLTVLDLGFGNAVIRYTAKLRAQDKHQEQYELFGMFIVLYSIIGVIAFIVGLSLYNNVDTFFGSTMTSIELDRARTMMLLMVFNVAITFPFSVFGSIITAYEKFVVAKGLNIVRTILNTVVMICLLHMGYKAIAMVVVQTIFNITTLIINYLYCRYKLRIKVVVGKFNWSFLKEVAIYSFWIFLCIIVERVYWSTGQFVLGAKIGTSSVAVFSLAITLVQLYMNFSTSISGVFLPRVTGMIAQNAPNNELLNLFVKTGRIQFYIVSLIFSGFIVFGRDFINLWAGPEYMESYVICIICFAALFTPLVQTLGPIILQAKNEMKFRSLLLAIFSVVCLVLQVLLSPRLGGIGCAIALFISFSLGQGVVLNAHYHYKQKLNMVLFWKEIAKLSLIPISLAIISYHIIIRLSIDSFFVLLACVTIYSIIYCVASYFISFNAYEKSLILSFIKKIKSKYDY